MKRFGQHGERTNMKRPSSPTIKRLRITRDGLALVFGCVKYIRRLYYQKEACETNFEILGVFSNRSSSNTMLSFDDLGNTFRDIRWTWFSLWGFLSRDNQVGYNMSCDLVVGQYQGRKKSEQRLQSNSRDQRWVSDGIYLVQKIMFHFRECD